MAQSQTAPSELAARLLRQVPARQRSIYVAEALIEKLARRERRLERACAIANRAADVRRLEREFDAIEPGISEPWSDTR